MKRVLFIDRGETLAIEPPADYQLDSLEKLEFYLKVIRNFGFVRSKLDSELVVVTNQDELGTASFPEETLWPAHNLITKTLEDEGVTFDDICIDRSMPKDSTPTRKPRTGMLAKYLGNLDYDLVNSSAIDDRTTDMELAKSLGCRAIFLQENTNMLEPKSAGGETTCRDLEDVCALTTRDWDKVVEFFFAGEREAEVRHITEETSIYVAVGLNGNGRYDVHTGLGFFDHMLGQAEKRGDMDPTIHVKGDLGVDEHHTIENAALALDDCLYRALGNKRDIERYDYALPMGDCLCQAYLGFGGRPQLVWDAGFKRRKIGEMPTEVFLHFFRSLSDAAKMSLNIRAEGQNKHHKIEGIFKALVRALKMTVERDIYRCELPSSKGML